MYTKDTTLKSLAMANMNPVVIMDQNPLTHPSYATFSEAMVEERESTAKAGALRKLLIDGFCHQGELSKNAQREAEVIENAAQFSALLIKHAIPESLGSIYQDNFIYSSGKTTDAPTAKKQGKARESYMNFLRDAIHSTSPESGQLVHRLRALLTISENREPALWSGGIDLSTFSYDKGHCPLEQTVLGNLLNSIPTITLRDLETLLWDIIPRIFVLQYTRFPVHVYFRVFDSTSVLLRQELPLAQKNSTALAIHWYPAFNYPKGMAEIGVHGEVITELGRGIDDMKAAVELLITKLEAVSYKVSKQAYEKANNGYFDSTRPPFAADE